MAATRWCCRRRRAISRRPHPVETLSAGHPRVVLVTVATHVLLAPPRRKARA